MNTGVGDLVVTVPEPPLSPALRSTRNTSLEATNPNPWQLVSHNKRAATDTPSRNVRPRSESQNSIATQNRFQILDNNDNTFQTLENQNNDESSDQKTPPKPPPIFLPGIVDTKPLYEILDLAAKDNYFIKAINNNQIKVQSKTSDDFRNIIKQLKEKNVSFHTFQLKEERSFRVVIRNLHHSTNLDDLKREIEEHGHTVRNIYNVKQKLTKKPLPLFFLELQPNPTNKSIYGLEFLQHTKIQIEPPQTKKDIPQCAKCQRYGLTKVYCQRQPRCVKCGQNHNTSECKKENTTPAICVLCQGKHPANYKGWAVYQEIRNRKFPSLRPRQPTNIDQTSAQTSQHNTDDSSRNNTRPTYADKLKNPTTADNSNSAPMNQYNLEKMMSKLMDRMDTMLNILTALITKINNGPHA